MIRNLRVSPRGATAEVSSRKEADKWYHVVISGSGEGRCACLHSLIRRVECAHVDEVRRHLKIETAVKKLEDMLTRMSQYTFNDQRDVHLVSREERTAIKTLLAAQKGKA